MAHLIGLRTSSEAVLSYSNVGQQLIEALQSGRRQATENILRHSDINLISINDLGHAFTICIQETYFGKIPSLPNLERIPANGEWGLGRAFIQAIPIQNHDSLRLIQGLPNFRDIEANGTWGLGQALKDCVQNLLEKLTLLDHPSFDPEFLYAIVEHPHASQIQFQNDLSDSIGKVLHFIATKSHDKVHQHYEERIVQALLHAHISQAINSDIEGPLELGACFTNAATNNESLVPIILHYPGSDKISAKVLGVGLIWAAAKGHVKAIQSILQHPNAPKISQEARQASIKIAQDRGDRGAAALISL